jgi:glycosyltransferase involved in cell wall biosynthesis
MPIISTTPGHPGLTPAQPLHRVLIVSDAWRPQVNGVVRTLEWLCREAPAFGMELVMLTPDQFRSVGMPSYPEIRLSLAMPGAVSKRIDAIRPDAIHIATEGPLGYFARLHCLRKQKPFTTCYHTRFPEYLAARAPVPTAWTYAVLRKFHAAAAASLVSTDALREELAGHGFRNLKIWRRGIDLDLFRSGVRSDLRMPGPISLYVGRVAVEKNIEAFLAADLPGSKIVVGDGPARAELARRFPEVRFTGSLHGQALADIYASADVFVFPSRTDTFGLVMLEALAAGTPVAALPVTGPSQVLGNSGCGVMSEDLPAAVRQALEIPREKCRAFASNFGIRESARCFFDHVSAALISQP